MMQGMNYLQSSTQKELNFLKERLGQLEGFVGKLYIEQKSPTSSSIRASANPARLSAQHP